MDMVWPGSPCRILDPMLEPQVHTRDSCRNPDVKASFEPSRAGKREVDPILLSVFAGEGIHLGGVMC